MLYLQCTPGYAIYISYNQVITGIYVICLPVQALIRYPIMACQCHFHGVVSIINIVKLSMELKCHYDDVTDVDGFFKTYSIIQKQMFNAEPDFLSC